MNKKLEMAANIATLMITVLIGYVVIDRYVVNRPQAATSSIAAGDRVQLTDVDWRQNGRTLVLVLQKGCHFCSESAPFYQKLAQQAGQSGKVHLMAVLPQTPKEAADYLGEIGVAISDVRQARLRTVKVQGTPTLLLVSSSGLVEKVWIGKLPLTKETEVLQSL